MQESEKIVKGKNTGKANATTDKEQADIEAQRIVDRKMEEGYTKKGQKSTNVFLFNPLPTSFAPSKPHSNKPKDIETNMGDYCAERKNNGVNLLRVVDLEGNDHIYTRGIKEITDIVKKITPLQALNSIPLPPGTIISFEFINYDKDKKEVPKDLRGIVSDKTTMEKATDRFESLKAKGHTFATKVFDVLYYKKENTTAMEYQDRRTLLEKIVWKVRPNCKSEFFFRFNSDVVKIGKDKSWEGFVLRKLTGPDSGVEFTLDGKPHRKGAWKYVFEKSGDFVITEVQLGDAGRLNGLPARFHLGQYDSKEELVDCQWAGPGKVTTDDLTVLAKDLKIFGKPPKSVHNVFGLTASDSTATRSVGTFLKIPLKRGSATHV